MSVRNAIAECIISCRNILLSGRSNENVLISLKDALANIDLILVPSSKAIVSYCVSKAVDEVKSSNYMSAGLILNLIHNFLLDKESERTWEIDYFLSIELPEFLERFDEVKAAREIVLIVCNELALWYLKKS
jgi:hypothetical protein